MATFLLIHGAYQGGWIWSPVVKRLQAQGHRALAPSLDGCAERASQNRPGIDTESHAAELAELLRFEDLDDVILAGTSSGGMVLARTAELARDRIQRIAFVDALALFPGEKIRDIVQRPAEIETDIAVGPTRDSMFTALRASMDDDLAGWAADRFGLHPAAVFHQPVVLDSFWEDDWDASVTYCRQAPNPGEAHQRRCAERLGARWYELDTGHYPMLSDPDAVTDILLNG